MTYNQIDLGKIYGLSGNPGNRMLANTGNNLPSLEEIAKEQLTGKTDEQQSYPTINTSGTMNNSGNQLIEDINRNIDNIDSDTSDKTNNEIIPYNNGGTQNLELNNQNYITSESIQYLNGFLRTQIGRTIEVHFMAGNEIIVVSGVLLGVGSDFLLINERGTNNLATCDFFNIKFVRLYY